MNHLKINKIAELIKNSKNMVVLTGAGVSTGSGIPDFRTPGKGLWEKVDPYEVTSIDAFHENPKRFYHFIDLELRCYPAFHPILHILQLPNWKRWVLQSVSSRRILIICIEKLAQKG